MYSKALKDKGSIRKAAESLGLSKSKFMVLYKKELKLCTATTNCKNKPEAGKTRCAKHLRYASSTQNKELKTIKNKKHYWSNPEDRKIASRKWAKSNPEKMREYNRKYSKTKKGKTCNRSKRAKRRAAKLNAIPKWADLAKIKQIYAECPLGHHVDHIVPLQGENVCGLHVEYNLQYLPGEANIKKSNKL